MPAPLSRVRLIEVDQAALDDIFRLTMSNGSFVKIQEDGISIVGHPGAQSRFFTWDIILNLRSVTDE